MPQDPDDEPAAVLLERIRRGRKADRRHCSRALGSGQWRDQGTFPRGPARRRHHANSDPGVIHGKTIELAADPGLADGQGWSSGHESVPWRPVPGEGSCGRPGLADDPEFDAVIGCRAVAQGGDAREVPRDELPARLRHLLGLHSGRRGWPTASSSTSGRLSIPTLVQAELNAWAYLKADPDSRLRQIDDLLVTMSVSSTSTRPAPGVRQAPARPPTPRASRSAHRPLDRLRRPGPRPDPRDPQHGRISPRSPASGLVDWLIP